MSVSSDPSSAREEDSYCLLEDFHSRLVAIRSGSEVEVLAKKQTTSAQRGFAS